MAFTLMFGWSKDALGSFGWGFAVLAGLAALTLGPALRALEKRRPGQSGA